MASGSVCVTPWRLPAKKSVAPNSPSPRAKESAAAALRPGAASGMATRPERPCRAGPERARGVEEVLVERLERADCPAHVERAGDEEDRHHDRRLREADRDAQEVERAAEQSRAARTPPAARCPQPRGEHERQLDRREHDRAAAEPPARDEVGGRRADEEDDRLRDEARLRRDDERVEDDAAPQLAQELARRHAEEDRGDRQQEEREREAEREDEREVEGRAAHHDAQSESGAVVSRARPVVPSTRCTNAWPTPCSSLDVTTQMPYRIGGVRRPGHADDADPRLQGRRIRAVDEAGVGLAERDLASTLRTSASSLTTFASTRARCRGCEELLRV